GRWGRTVNVRIGRFMFQSSPGPKGGRHLTSFRRGKRRHGEGAGSAAELTALFETVWSATPRFQVPPRAAQHLAPAAGSPSSSPLPGGEREVARSISITA